MRGLPTVLVLVLATVGCGGQPSATPSAAPVPKAATAIEHDAAASPGAASPGAASLGAASPGAASPGAASSVAASSGAASPGAPPSLVTGSVDAATPGAADAADAAAAARMKPPPPPVQRTGKTWPFHAWTRAEAVLFNQFPMQPGAQLRAYDENGWSAHVVQRKPLDEAMAQKAVAIAKDHEGDVAVSKCPFPRHAVVLFDGDVPIASINVCFQCGDIMLWPRWSPAPDWSKMTDAQMKAHWAREEKHLKRYEAVFPRWRKYFADEVQFPMADFSH